MIIFTSLSKHNIYALFERLEQFFSCFYHSIFNAPFCYLVGYLIHALSEQDKYCLFQYFLQCFDMIVLQIIEPEVEYDLNWLI